MPVGKLKPSNRFWNIYLTLISILYLLTGISEITISENILIGIGLLVTAFLLLTLNFLLNHFDMTPGIFLSIGIILQVIGIMENSSFILYFGLSLIISETIKAIYISSDN